MTHYKSTSRSRRFALVPVLLALLGSLALALPAQAADALYRFTHNGQDLLAVGTVTSVGEGSITFSISEILKSSSSIGGGSSPLPSSEVRREIKVERGEALRDLQPGDAAILSLKKKMWGSFVLDNGAYRLDSTALPVQASTLAGEENAETAAVTFFVNSRGVFCEFAFEGDDGRVALTYKGQDYLIYDRAAGGIQNPQIPGTPSRLPTEPKGDDWFANWQSPAVLIGILAVAAGGAIALRVLFKKRKRRHTIYLK